MQLETPLLDAQLPETRPEIASDLTAPTVIHMNEVQARPLEWLCLNWVPMGKLTLLDGDPGQAKSLLLVDLAARVSTGQAMPDDSAAIEGNVTFLAPEDGLGDTLLPRLQAAGADLSRIHVIPNFVSIRNLEAEVRKSKTRLLIV